MSFLTKSTSSKRRKVDVKTWIDPCFNRKLCFCGRRRIYSMRSFAIMSGWFWSEYVGHPVLDLSVMVLRDSNLWFSHYRFRFIWLKSKLSRNRTNYQTNQQNQRLIRSYPYCLSALKSPRNLQETTIDLFNNLNKTIMNRQEVSFGTPKQYQFSSIYCH
jgi:hypothetical protein